MKRNPVARAVRHIRPKVVRDKTKYDRKRDKRAWERR